MNDSEKKTGIGSFGLFSLGFGAIVGVGWAVSINRWMAHSGGPLPASIGYLIALIMMVPVALCYAELASMMPVAGGGMAYAYRAFNEKLSFVSGWAAFGAFVTIIPWEAIYVVDVLSLLLPAAKGPLLYEVAGTGIHLGHIVIGTVVSTLLYWVNRKGAHSSAKVQRFLTIFLVGTAVVAMGVAFLSFDPEHLRPVYENVGQGSHDGFLGGAFAILATAPFFLSGFETIPQAVEDASGSGASVGKIVVITVALACLFYAALLFSLGGAMPWQAFYALESPAAANLFRVVFDGPGGTLMYYLILIGALTGLFTTWNGFMMASPRLLMALARARLVPGFFAKQHPKYDTPTNGLLFCYVLSLAGPFLGMGLIDPLTSFSAAGFVLSWVITTFCVVALRKREPDALRPYKMPGGAVLAGAVGVLMAVVFLLLFIPNNPVFMGTQAVWLFIGWMLIGVLLYRFSANERHSMPPQKREDILFANAEE
ncbi:MAG: APC family permease [Peptoniphilaceae bacterium]|jgi:APA family basic amino acid/polyamine antiporter